jgi:hypothetical protein
MHGDLTSTYWTDRHQAMHGVVDLHGDGAESLNDLRFSTASKNARRYTEQIAR